MNPKISISVLLFLFYFSLYAFTMKGQIRFGDEAERYLTAQSIVERHDLAIQFDQRLHRHIGLDGRNYSFYELGSTLPLVPFYAVGNFVAKFFPSEDPNWIETLFTGLLNPLLTALTCVLLYRFAIALGNSAKSALFTSMLLGLATIAWPYSKGLEREPILSLCLLLTVYAAFMFRQSGETKWLWATGASLGFLLFAKIATVILVPFFALYIATEFLPIKRDRSAIRSLLRLSCFAIPIVVLVGVQAIYNQVRYGDFTDIGLVSEMGNPITFHFGLSYLNEMLPAFLSSQEKGVFIYSPPLLLLLPGWIKFVRRNRQEALLIASLIIALGLFYSLDRSGTQVGWWGPKELVDITPLGLVPISILLTETRHLLRRFWYLLAFGLGLVGAGIQMVALLVDDREYSDVTGNGIDFAGGIDFLRHGAMDSLLINLSPIGRFVQVNIYGIGMFFVAVLLFVWIIKKISHEKEVGGASLRWNSALLAVVLVAEFFSFITWVVAPYTQVMIAKANTRFVAGNLFLADNRKCEASAMYLQALTGRTIYLTNAFARIRELLPRAQGRRIAPSDLVANVQASEGAMIEEDDADALNGESSLKISLPAEKDEDVYVYTDPIGAEPNQTYELSGWIKVEGIYGEKYAVVSIVEDDGNWGNSRGTTILSVRGTYGWQPFAQTIATLPTTKRIFLRAGLWRTHGTVWLGLLQFAKITEDNPATKILRSCPS